MSNTGSKLTPRERVEAALALHHIESPGTPLSVSKICAEASVSRANLYTHHPDLVKKILGSAKTVGKRAPPTTTVADLKVRLAAEKKRANALLLVCVELQAEVRRLRAREVLNLEVTSKKPGWKPKA
jgi:hypothetical protein